MGLEARQPIANAPAQLWPLLVDTRSWKAWWPAVRDARSGDGRPLHEGSKFEVTLELGSMVATLHPRIALLADGKSLAWEGNWYGAAVRQEWFLEPRPEGTRFVLRARFSGPLASIHRLLKLDMKWAAMMDEQARGLRKVGERL